MRKAIKAPISCGTPTSGFTLSEGDHGVIRSTPVGFWELDLAKQYVRALGELMDASRRERGRVRIVSDNRRVPVHRQEVHALLIEGILDRLADGDKIGFVVASTLKKLQVTRTGGEIARGFLTVEEAISWVRV